MKDTHRVYGTVTMGARGQAVIPMRARRLLGIKPGDKLIVMSGPPGRKEIISFIPVNDISKFLQHFEDHIAKLKKEVSKETE